MKIFYFNVTYTCNSNCVFCYSHNTIHSGRQYKDIIPEEFVAYLKLNNVNETDRVIINGGEPFLHPNIIYILKSLASIQCEVLIYTNGRCLKDKDFSFMNRKYRFVIPIHGYKQLHDRITKTNGSFEEMTDGIKHLMKFDCKIDIKIILNPLMVSSRAEFDKSLREIDTIPFNNAVHITTMADTIISKKNGIPSVENDLASIYTELLFNHFVGKQVVIKMFDTCVKNINVFGFNNKYIPLEVYFKDVNSSWLFDFYTPNNDCRKECSHKEICQSAVGNFTVLEYDGQFYKGIE